VRLIEKEEAAKRLARVILSDIELYNRPAAHSRAELEPQLNEGYALFRSRVVPALVPIFSEVVSDRFPPENKVARAPARGPARAIEAPPPEPPAAAAPAAHRQPLPPREAARRLARVMVSSIERVDRDDGGAGLSDDIEEARKQFQSCVLPELAAVFDEALVAHGLFGAQAPRRAAPEPPAEPTTEPFEWVEVSPGPDAVPPGDATDRVTVPEALMAEESDAAAAAEDDAPTHVVPLRPAPAPSSAPQRALSKVWLAAVALAMAAASAGIVYYLLSAR
jgi:hypothetical protein